jgi:hypothetical protein
MQLEQGWLSVACRSLILLVAVILAGCGESGAAKAPVKGKVVANGQPVTGGRLTFAPADAANVAVSVVGQIQSDGTFVMSTDREGDGVAIGKHQLTYSAPDAQVTETTDGSDPLVKQSPYAGMVVQQSAVEIKPGQNELTIELIRGPNP